MNRNDITGLEVFLAIAKAGTLRAASDTLGVNPPAVSHQLKAFETRLGVTLFNRNTRSIQLTEAGRVLVNRCQHVTDSLADALEEARHVGKSRVGTLRVTLPYRAWQLVIAPKLRSFQETYPDVRLDFSINEGLVEIVSEGFHAGIRLGDHLQPDMIGRRLTGPIFGALVASPEYLRTHGTPRNPDALYQFKCIRYRGPRSGQITPWMFYSQEGVFSVDPGGVLVVDDMRTAIDAAEKGLGIAWSLRDGVTDKILAGTLLEVLKDYSTQRPGFHLYYSKHVRELELMRLFIGYFC